jgi:hypothetical protein
VSGASTGGAERLSALLSRARTAAKYRWELRRNRWRLDARVRRARRNRRILVLGDSHARVFADPTFKAFPGRFEIHSVIAATVSGLQNPNSVTQAGPIFERALSEAAARRNPPMAVILQIGEVDCGFVIWWMHEQKGLSLDAGLSRAVENLVVLAKRAQAVAPVFVVSAPLPTIRDNVDFGEYANLRREIKASQEARTALVIDFNRRAQEALEAVGVTHINLDEKSLGPDGLVSPLLALRYKTNHHYDMTIYGRLLERTLRRMPPFRP